ncbi:NAD(P)H-hydrate dehydratase [Nocardioides mesophilus]|uniref:NAD(P)H-hydrate dehydratase n=1 Tax=Nocardioides mesophilus TaxID=433659 RepID=UPI001CB6F031|nr:NAD(P)H-hydrate dehydratase [Nocardioides mesophilus]
MAEPTTVTPELLRGWQLPEPGSDKEARGVVLVVGGSGRTAGAVVLAGEAALRVGGGKLQVATARTVTSQVGPAVPEALVMALAEDDEGELTTEDVDRLVELARDAEVALLGPGIQTPATAQALLGALVPQLSSTVVVDALGSAYLTENPEGLHHLDGRCVVTVNPGELARTLHVDDEEVERDQEATTVELAKRLRAVVVCGGSRKVVATPQGQLWQVLAGGPGLGVAGSGDVQAGFVTGLLARGADPAQAAVWGAFLHGAAGDRLAADVGPIGFLAREIPCRAPGLLAGLTG